jgi:hypothetical protein
MTRIMRITKIAGALVCIGIAGCRGERSPAARRNGAAASNAPAATHDCGVGVLSGSGIGALRIGTAVDSVRAQCQVVRDTTELREEGLAVRVITVVVPRDTVEAEVDSGKVWRIEVLHPALRTSDSLGVGTSLDRLLQLRGVHGVAGEGAVFVLSPAHCGLSFELSEPGSDAPTAEWDLAALRRLPTNTTVRRVLITGCQAAA